MKKGTTRETALNDNSLNFNQAADGTLLIQIRGDWKIGNPLPSAEEVGKKLAAGAGVGRVGFDTSELKAWDSGLLTFLTKMKEICSQNKIQLELEGLPEGARGLLKLASAVAERKGARKEIKREPYLSLVGARTIEFYRSTMEMVSFIGEATVTFAKFLVGKATFRRVDLFLLLQECGAQALPVVSLISMLLGLILAFVGAIQLKMFGAQIFVADVVAIGMVRVLGAIMTGIIMAGRTGAAFAAQIGTMEVNEEIDALKTLGISPMEFLVLPRMIALIIMMPLLCVYSDLLGILGGLIVGVGMLDLGLTEYMNRTREALNLTTFGIGLFHSAVFGVLVALSGCLRGMQCERSASAVGYAATSAVVTSIVAIIVATAIITFVCQVLGI
ncbi:MAG TPA: ABC transporter permease [Thermodesulfobacteriota bacterium]|nr:ABC transporter permease [Thermodesulfobacteriota bacterium]